MPSSLLVRTTTVRTTTTTYKPTKQPTKQPTNNQQTTTTTTTIILITRTTTTPSPSPTTTTTTTTTTAASSSHNSYPSVTSAQSRSDTKPVVSQGPNGPLSGRIIPLMLGLENVPNDMGFFMVMNPMGIEIR